MYQFQANTRLKFGVCDSRNYSGEHKLVEQNSSEQLQGALNIYTSNRHTRKYMGADKSLNRPGRKQATATEHCEFHISYL